MTIDELLCKFQGKCWHTVMQEADVQRIIPVSAICVCGAIFENNGSIKRHIKDSNPDYSRPADLYEFFSWLCREKPEMWDEFLSHACEAWLKTPDTRFYPWLFFSDPSRPRDLMAEWLRLDEVREKWGWEKCPTCWRPGDYTGPLPMFCPSCNGTGRIRAEWAREGK